MDPEWLDADATVFVPGVDEFYGIKGLAFSPDDDVLDKGHPFLEL